MPLQALLWRYLHTFWIQTQRQQFKREYSALNESSNKNPDLCVSDQKSPWLNQPKMALSSPTNSQSNSLNSKYLFLCILQTRGFEPNTKCGTLFKIKQPSSIKTYQITKQHILLWILNINFHTFSRSWSLPGLCL